MSAGANLSDEIVSQLLRLEQSLLDPTFRRDRARVSALLADDFVEFGSSGRVWTRDRILDLLATDEYTPPVIENYECRQIAESVALVSYQTVRTNPETGEPAITLRSSIWSKESGIWLLRFHQGTRAY